MRIINLKFRESSANDYYENYVFTYFGESMKGLSPHALHDDDIIQVAKKNVKDALFDGYPLIHLLDDPLFVVCPYGAMEYVAAIKDISLDGAIVTFEFINPNKELFPDLVLSFFDIRQVLPVVQIARDLTSHLPCHCASDGEYCGPECVNSELKSVNHER